MCVYKLVTVPAKTNNVEDHKKCRKFVKSICKCSVKIKNKKTDDRELSFSFSFEDVRKQCADKICLDGSYTIVIYLF